MGMKRNDVKALGNTTENLTDVMLSERSPMKEYILYNSVSLTFSFLFLMYKVVKTWKLNSGFKGYMYF